MEKEKRDWFTELFPEVPPDYPPDLKIEGGKPYRITFEEKKPRVVAGGYGKKTAVIIVTYKGERRSLYVGSNVDLARQINNLWLRKSKSLKGCTVDIAKMGKKGRNWLYKVAEVDES
jgi:hypothetical protein